MVVHVRVARRLLADYAPLEISLWGSRRGDLDLTSSCDAVGLGSSAGNRLVGPVPMTGRTRDVVLPRTRLRAFYRHFASVSVAGKYTGTVWGCADLAPG